jgi:radical SAM superfamily enzyme YgiQ (UPF0313 family)
MSGLRICKPELLELGFTFPNVAERARQIEALPTLGLLTLAGMTPAHIDVEYLEVRDVHNGPLPARFDAVAISTLAGVSKEAYALAHRFRSAGTPVIIGGLHPTLRPQEAMMHADAIAIGEGELVWPQIVADLERGALKHIYDARGMGPFDLSNAPMPRFDLLDPTRYPRFSVQTQRGCPWSCEFCASSIRLNPKFRVKPIEKVIAEIRQLKALYGNPFIEFADDNTFVNRDHARKLMKALEREHIRWFTESDLNVADDPELLAMMRDAGCAQVLIGFESPSYSELDGIELNANWKAKKLDRYLSCVEKVQRHGITVNGCFVLGLDGSGPETASDILRFVRDSGLYDVQITVMTPFPGTPLWDRLRDQGRILDESATEKCTLFDINFQPDGMSVSDLESQLVRLAGLLYDERFVKERGARFKRHLRERVQSRTRPSRTVAEKPPVRIDARSTKPIRKAAGRGPGAA